MVSRSSKNIYEEAKNKDMIKTSSVTFANKELEKSFNKLEENAFCGIRIPKEYIQKYKITNLWEYNLPDAWRLVYSITTPNKVEILCVILEWFSHPDYEKRFHYLL